MDYDTDIVLRKALERYAHLDSIKVRFFPKHKHYKMSYHVYAGCSGDWHEDDTYSQFTFIHFVLGYQLLF